MSQGRPIRIRVTMLFSINRCTTLSNILGDWVNLVKVTFEMGASLF